MKRHDFKPRPCSCNGTCQKCDGTIKPYEFDTQRIFENRKYCCVFCPAKKAKQKTYRHVKKIEPVKKTSIDLWLAGSLR